MTMREYIDKVAVTVEQVQRKVMDFVRERDNVTIIGAWAVNMYADDVDEEQRQTADIDLMTTDADMQVLLTAYVYAHLGVRLKNHSVYPDLVRLYVDGMNNNKPIVDIVRGTAESENKDGLRVATIRWQIENKKKAIASPARSEIKRLRDRSDLLILEKAEACGNKSGDVTILMPRKPAL